MEWLKKVEKVREVMETRSSSGVSHPVPLGLGLGGGGRKPSVGQGWESNRFYWDENMSSNGAITKRLYTIPEAGIYLGRTKWSIRRLIWNGDLPSVRPPGRRVHVDLRDMDAFIEQNKVIESN